MNIVVLHGSPRKGNTYHATKLFMNELSSCGEVNFTEFFMPADLPAFCTGCQLCLGGMQHKCPSAQPVSAILQSLLSADALIFATPHYGACSMPAAMKNLFDHLDFLVLPVSPHAEMFTKKAFIITTGTGSAAAIKPIKKVLKHWGINRVQTLGIRLFTTRWHNMAASKQTKHEHALRKSARKFYHTRIGRPTLSTVAFYHMSKFVLKKYVGPGNYPYEYWKEKGYFDKRPF
ncbi:MAG: NAD(P)H-dependent oxidoreductase [Oscillospiraceae bacterium]|nr:NAD(P)H-dependent oxidoreductase [Oscillospiraceae bacterium]